MSESSSQTNPPSPADLARMQTEMATLRTQLALSRTTLAWIRTTLTMTTFGFGMVGFFRSLEQQSPSAETLRQQQGAIHFGLALVLIGMIATALAGLAHWQTMLHLRRGQMNFWTQGPLVITLTAILTLLGLYGLWTLVIR
jgi:putative membrane protein